MKKIYRLIDKASFSYITFRGNCELVAIEAQRYINWDDDIGCDYFPSDGLCLTTTKAHVCPIGFFFAAV